MRQLLQIAPARETHLERNRVFIYVVLSDIFLTENARCYYSLYIHVRVFSFIFSIPKCLSKLRNSINQQS